MQTKQENSLITSLKHILSYCKELQTLFTHDKQSLIKNEHATLTVSNDKKNIVLKKIDDAMHEVNLLLNDTSPRSLFEKIKTASIHFTQVAKQELQAIERELTKEIPHCYQQIIVNKTLVSESVIRLRTINSKLLACKEDVGCVYDNRGNTIK